MSTKPTLLGPFIGHTTSVNTKIWIYSETHQNLFIKIYQEKKEIRFAEFHLQREIPACCITINDLIADTKYTYKIFIDKQCKELLQIEDLNNEDFYFWTMPENFPSNYEYNFLIMSCHNPLAEKRKDKNGWAVWQAIPQIIEKSIDAQKNQAGYYLQFWLVIKRMRIK